MIVKTVLNTVIELTPYKYYNYNSLYEKTFLYHIVLCTPIHIIE